MRGLSRADWHVESKEEPHQLSPDAPERSDDRFWFGLGCVLEGIAAAIAAA